MSSKLKKTIMTLAFTLVGLLLNAQGKPAGPPPPTERMPPSFPGLAVPIDERLIVLILLGILLGIYAVYKHTSVITSAHNQ